MADEANPSPSGSFADETSAADAVAGLLSLDDEPGGSEGDDESGQDKKTARAPRKSESDAGDDDETEDETEDDGADEDEEGADDDLDEDDADDRDADDDGEDDDTEEGDDDAEDDDETAFDPPARWSREDKEAFQALPAPAQKLVLERNQAMEADYTRKSQALASERTQFEEDAASAATELRSRFERLEALIPQLEAQISAEPDLDKVFEEDPVEGARLQREHQKRQEALEAAREEHAEEMQRRAVRYTKQQKEALLEIRPEWKDPKVYSAETKAIAEFLVERYNAPPEDLKRLTDHRVLDMAADAMAYRKLMAKKKSKREIAKKKVSGKGKVLKGGSSGQIASKGERAAKLRNRLKKSHREEDAVALLMED